MIAVLKLLVRIHAWLVAGAVYEFKIAPRGMRDWYYQRGWGWHTTWWRERMEGSC